MTSRTTAFSPPKAEDDTIRHPVFGHLDAKEIKSCYLTSRNIRALAFLYCILGLLLPGHALWTHDPDTIFYLLLGSGMLLTGIGYGTRAFWGNGVGLIFSLACFLGFMGTLVSAHPEYMLLIYGGIGCWIFVTGKRLFGENGLTHEWLEDAVRPGRKRRHITSSDFTLSTAHGALDAKRVKSLYMSSSNLYTLAGVYILFGSWLMYVSTLSLTTHKAIMLFSGLGFLVVGIGYLRRARWGNIAGLLHGIAMSILGLVVTPPWARPGLIGLIFGVIGCHIYLTCKWLFGEDRITHKVLEAAYRRSKR